jgi:hypothetical protein
MTGHPGWGVLSGRFGDFAVKDTLLDPSEEGRTSLAPRVPRKLRHSAGLPQAIFVESLDRLSTKAVWPS